MNLEKGRCAALLIDVQEKLFPHIDQSKALLATLQMAVRGFQILQVPLFATEQYPEGLGATIPVLKIPQTYSKTRFSCLPALNPKQDQYILMGIEAHVCVLQSAKGLLQAGKQVAVLADAIGSRSPRDLAIAIAEMRDMGVRISSLETVLFELMQDAKCAEFKQISALIKCRSSP